MKALIDHTQGPDDLEAILQSVMRELLQAQASENQMSWLAQRSIENALEVLTEYLIETLAGNPRAEQVLRQTEQLRQAIVAAGDQIAEEEGDVDPLAIVSFAASAMYVARQAIGQVRSGQVPYESADQAVSELLHRLGIPVVGDDEGFRA